MPTFLPRSKSRSSPTCCSWAASASPRPRFRRPNSIPASCLSSPTKPDSASRETKRAASKLGWKRSGLSAGERVLLFALRSVSLFKTLVFWTGMARRWITARDHDRQFCRYASRWWQEYLIINCLKRIRKNVKFRFYLFFLFLSFLPIGFKDGLANGKDRRFRPGQSGVSQWRRQKHSSRLQRWWGV